MRILLGVDLRIDGHQWLIDQAVRFAERLGGEIDLLYVTGKEEEAQVAERQAILDELLASIPVGVRGKALTRSGPPVEGLLEATADYSALVVGPREPDALTRWFVGPMAARVIHRAKCPVLIPRADLPGDETLRILVGVDPHRGSSKWLVAMGGEWAEALQARLDVVYVDPVRVPYIADAKVREQAQRELANARKPDRLALEALLQSLAPEVRGEASIIEGEPGRAIVDRSADYAFVLVGTLERTGMSRLVLGSVAEHVVRNAECSVLTLPAILRVDASDEG